MKIMTNESNYIELIHDSIIYLFSYTTLVAKLDTNTNTLYATSKYYSHTTSKHINRFKNKYAYKNLVKCNLE